MSSTQKSNPTKGTKNTTDPAAKGDQKAEFSGAVTKDSLAAESLRSGGDFSRGNPTGIIGVTADNSTLNTTGGGGKVREIYGKKSDEERYGEASVDPVKSTEVGASGGGNQANDSFVGDVERRPIREALGGSVGGGAGRSLQATHSGSDTGRESTRDDNWRHGGGRGGGGGRGSKQSAGSGPTGGVNRVVPNTALDEQVNEPGLDWSKIPKHTKPPTDIDSEKGPEQVAEHHLVKQAAKKEQRLGDTGGGIERTVEEGSIFDYLKGNENA